MASTMPKETNVTMVTKQMETAAQALAPLKLDTNVTLIKSLTIVMRYVETA